MNVKKETVMQPRTGRLGRAIKAVQQFYLRDLARVDTTNSTVHEASPLPADDSLLKGRKHSFSGELFAELLLELPMHRDRLACAAASRDVDALRNAVHQLLGAVAYCDAPELEAALRELRVAIKSGEQDVIDSCHERAINVIDLTLMYSGYRGHGACRQP